MILPRRVRPGSWAGPLLLLGLCLAGLGPAHADGGTSGAAAATQPKAKAAAQQPAAPPPAKPPKPPPDNTELLPASEVMALMGTKVRDLAGEDMGLVVDVVVDLTGKPRALVIDFGGFLGVGSRKIAIDWRLVHFQPKNQDAPVLLHLGRAEVQAAPEFVPGVEPLRMLGPPPDGPASPNAGP